MGTPRSETRGVSGGTDSLSAGLEDTVGVLDLASLSVVDRVLAVVFDVTSHESGWGRRESGEVKYKPGPDESGRFPV